MKRFIDLRGQHTGFRFAWYCTVVDQFEGWYGYFAWDTWDEFAETVKSEGCWNAADLEARLKRYRTLCPAWAFEPDPDDDFEEDQV